MWYVRQRQSDNLYATGYGWDSDLQKAKPYRYGEEIVGERRVSIMFIPIDPAPAVIESNPPANDHDAEEEDEIAVIKKAAVNLGDLYAVANV